MKEPFKVLAIIPALIPTTIIYIIKPLLSLHAHKKIILQVRLSQKCSQKDIFSSDIIVFCRNSEVNDLKYLSWATRFKKKIIYDIDDNFFEIDIDTPLGKYHRRPQHLYVLSQFLKMADQIRVYSTPMKQHVEIYNKNVKNTKAYFDLALLNDLNKPINNKIKIVYATARGNEDTLGYIFGNALARILSEFGDAIEVCIWGNIPSQLKKYNNVKLMQIETNYNKFIKQFYREGFQIGLAPVENGIFYRSKTNTKYRDYGACQIAGVYSDVEIYSECIINRENGILVKNNEEEWYSAIKELICNIELRSNIIANAYLDIQTNYSMDSFIKRWEEDIVSIMHSPDKALICNNISNLNLVIGGNSSNLSRNLRGKMLEEMQDAYNLKISYFKLDQLFKMELNDYDAIILLCENINQDFINQISRFLINYNKPVFLDFFDIDQNTLANMLNNTNNKSAQFIVGSEYAIEVSEQICIIPTYFFIDQLEKYFSPEKRNEEMYIFMRLSNFTERKYITFDFSKIIEIFDQMWMKYHQNLNKTVDSNYYSLNCHLVKWAEALDFIQPKNEPLELGFIQKKLDPYYKRLEILYNKFRINLYDIFTFVIEIKNIFRVLFKINYLNRL